MLNVIMRTCIYIRKMTGRIAIRSENGDVEVGGAYDMSPIGML